MRRRIILAHHCLLFNLRQHIKNARISHALSNILYLPVYGFHSIFLQEMIDF